MYLFIAVASTLAFLAFNGAVLFISAGTARIPMFWAYLIEQGLLYLIAIALIYVRSPDLIKERLAPGKGEQDRVSLGALNVGLIASWVLAGLDVGRFHWSNMPSALQVVGLAGIAIGFCIVLWAMLVNRFFSTAVRLQADRDQVVITTGPYRYVRHPGYSGGLVFVLGNGLALGSWPVLLLMALLTAVLIRRISIEERMLSAGLAGYADYAKEVRYRLVPGVW